MKASGFQHDEVADLMEALDARLGNAFLQRLPLHWMDDIVTVAEHPQHRDLYFRQHRA